jgi:hypothetical protein
MIVNPLLFDKLDHLIGSIRVKDNTLLNEKLDAKAYRRVPFKTRELAVYLM